jgi:serine/threonine protein kinase
VPHKPTHLPAQMSKWVLLSVQLHALDILMLDLKPLNVLMNRRGNAVSCQGLCAHTRFSSKYLLCCALQHVADFGLSRTLEQAMRNHSHVTTEHLAGTAPYMYGEAPVGRLPACLRSASVCLN